MSKSVPKIQKSTHTYKPSYSQIRLPWSAFFKSASLSFIDVDWVWYRKSCIAYCIRRGSGAWVQVAFTIRGWQIWPLATGYYELSGR